MGRQNHRGFPGPTRSKDPKMHCSWFNAPPSGGRANIVVGLCFLASGSAISVTVWSRSGFDAVPVSERPALQKVRGARFTRWRGRRSVGRGRAPAGGLNSTVRSRIRGHQRTAAIPQALSRPR